MLLGASYATNLLCRLPELFASLFQARLTSGGSETKGIRYKRGDFYVFGACVQPIDDDC